MHRVLPSLLSFLEPFSHKANPSLDGAVTEVMIVMLNCSAAAVGFMDRAPVPSLHSLVE